eukprot:gnl/TRDRNA2_/TRDRNA2_61177_c0_seq1.p1 gnl/TRDRNA2_/TRDRNA2_61177_c0~~gnl/TRDRNA2_/TRDRNA2_61177_c0_seq1.p1  ORF type:complete len:192 (-),score=34.63 gnl/TRDRNA2_/TRDRNA2_61177_c0_seq1:75-650(-)
MELTYSVTKQPSPPSEARHRPPRPGPIPRELAEDTVVIPRADCLRLVKQLRTSELLGPPAAQALEEAAGLSHWSATAEGMKSKELRVQIAGARVEETALALPYDVNGTLQNEHWQTQAELRAEIDMLRQQLQERDRQVRQIEEQHQQSLQERDTQLQEREGKINELQKAYSEAREDLRRRNSQLAMARVYC